MEARGVARERLKGNLDLLLLTVLRDGPAHGYDVIASLRARSDGTFDLPEGTVYPALHRLEQTGRLSSTWSEFGGRRRRTYRLTAAGAKALRAERQAWTRFAGSMNAIVAS